MSSAQQPATPFDANHFDAMLPAKPFLTILEVSKILCVSTSTVDKLIEDGQIIVHAFSGGTGLRKSKRIPRRGVIAFLLRTADYSPVHYLSGLVELLRQLSPAELEALATSQLPVLMAQARARAAGLQQG